MKLSIVFLILLFSFGTSAQKTAEALATANGQNYTLTDLSSEVRQQMENLPSVIADTRKSLLEQQINQTVLETEAAAQKTTVQKLTEKEVKAKIPAPTEEQIKAVYDANRAAIGTKTLEEIRPQIVAFLKREPEQRAFAAYISNLKTKYKVALGKDVNTPNLTGFEVLATIGNQQITTRSFEEKNKSTLNEIEAEAYEKAREALEQTIYYNLLNAEAKTLNIDSGDLIAREVTARAKTSSLDELATLETALKNKLFQKYNVKFLLKEIPPIVQNVSVDDDPAQGRMGAPVTVIMFTDFQCPACAATHPVVKSVLAEYADQVRFVVRDFPLISIHDNAFQAAVAAGAANAQGKFFEYTEILYQNQTRLDAASLKKYAVDLNLNQKQFDADLANQKIADEVRKDMEDGKKLNLGGTPTIFVNGVKVRSFSPENFRRAINKALKK